MVYVFEKYPHVEAKAVFWLKQNAPGFEMKTQAERVEDANLLSAEYAKKGYNLAWIAIGIAAFSLIVSIVAIVK